MDLGLLTMLLADLGRSDSDIDLIAHGIRAIKRDALRDSAMKNTVIMCLHGHKTGGIRKVLSAYQKEA